MCNRAAKKEEKNILNFEFLSNARNQGSIKIILLNKKSFRFKIF